MQLSDRMQLQGGKYLVERAIGQGGFGVTYLGVQTGLGRRVAIKEFFMAGYCTRVPGSCQVCVVNPAHLSQITALRDRFVREAQTIAELEHPHVVRIFDVFYENATAYYVMECIDGGSLKDRVERCGPLAEDEAVALIEQVGDALTHVHRKNILHLDVKPENIMMRSEREAVLIDFGISKHYNQRGDATSINLAPAYSPGYAPMEQYTVEGVQQFAPATDVYSLGATLYFLLTGQRPPEASVVMNQGLPPLPEGVAQATVDAVKAAMAPQRERRPQQVAHFLAMLQGARRAELTTDGQRGVIETLMQRHNWREAYDVCLDSIRQGVDVEFARAMCQQIIPRLERQAHRRSFWTTLLIVLGTLASFGISIVWALL